ncbi:MAG TPA: cbb3-type cytochrome c oxidase subunit I [Poseidonia sp.]|nr:cbb3-type cytochrome c oxidase subunit I [Poseidonia sp.]
MKRLLAMAILVLIAFAPTMEGVSNGIANVDSGCTCHGGGSASNDVTVTITGLPDVYNGSESYELTINITGGPEASGANSGGFNLHADGGEFVSLDNHTRVIDGPNKGIEMTHTLEGNDVREWTVQWNAPLDDTDDISFKVFGNAVDGDGLNSAGDLWSSQEILVEGLNSDGGPIIDFTNLAWWLIVLTILGLVAAVVVLMVRNPAVDKKTVMHWLTTTNHKDIGMLYLWTTLLFTIIGLALSLLIRIQLIVPDNDFMTGGLFNEAVTMHGAVMVLFAVSPMSFAFANYIVPLQIGAKDMAFPRLNAMSFWMILFGGLVAASGFFFGGAADAGWTFYSPLTSIEYSPGAGISLAGAGLVLLILSVTFSTVNFLVTILQMKTPGMPLMKMPMFTWNILFTVILMLAVFPALMAAVLMLVGDRVFGTMFFDPSIDGTTWWLHIFWFFGHPEVYIVLLPGLGMAMEIIPNTVRRSLYGRKIIIYSLVVASIISVLVWAHHMFITGINPTFRKIETIGTELVSVPFGLIYLSLLATFYRSKPDWKKLPLVFVTGAIGIFLVGGITGVYLSSVAMDVNLRGSYYLVAHFHYTLGAVAVMTLGGIYYWYPKMFGRMMDQKLGMYHFWITFIGINLTWIPLFGLTDMPRRIYFYQESAGWEVAHLIATIGGFVVFAGQLLFFYNFWRSMKHGEIAGPNPWNGSTLEWTVSSPPPPHNFDHSIGHPFAQEGE